jgi:2'-5' RNA ligase
MKRLFFAVVVPPEISQRLLGSFPEKNFPGIRFLDVKNLHVTLHFLGHLPDDKVNSLVEMFSPVITQCRAFDLCFEKFVALRKGKKLSHLWAQLESSLAFTELALGARRLIPNSESRPPLPHITIARIKQRRELPFDLPALPPFRYRAEKIELLESILDQDGPHYSVLHHWNLK